jgi:tetratricopeptide (TPR) repeat protein
MIRVLLLFQFFQPADLAKFHEQRIATLAPGSPQARQAHKDLGLFWLKHNNPPQAEYHLRQALPDPEILPNLAEAVAAQNRHAEADQLFQQCAQKARCLSRLAERTQDPAKALTFLRQALDTEPTPVRKNDYAQALHAAGKHKEAEALYRQALREQDPKLPEGAITLNNLATLLNATERYAEAEPLQRQALATMHSTLGPRHVRTALAASNLADILTARGRKPEAQALYKQALKIFEELLPPNHPWTLEARAALSPQR